MSFSFDFRACSASLSDSEKESLIYFTLFVGMPVITEKNVEDFASRVRAYERVYGALTAAAEFPQSLLLSAVGLRTNASEMTRAAFGKKLLQKLYRS